MAETSNGTGAENTDKPKLLRDTDEQARRLARTLLRGARYMSLAVIDAETGFPAASRVLTGTDIDGVPVILVSGLAGHTKALDSDPRASILAGETGKGDPLAHSRIMVQCLAERITREGDDHKRIRNRFVERHPKAKLYVDFPDFRFYRLVPQSALLNGGFGRAFALSAGDLIIENPGKGEEWENLHIEIKEMKNEAIQLAQLLGAKRANGWRFCGIDRAGVDLVSGDTQIRHEFDALATSAKCASQHILNHSKIL
jgi:putative heme iron utilization protein